MAVNPDVIRAITGNGPADNYTLCSEATNEGRNLREELKAAEDLKKENESLKADIQELREQATRNAEESERAFYSREDKVKNVTAVKDAYGRLKREADRIIHKACMDDIMYQRAYMDYKEAVNTAYDNLKE